MAENKDEKTEKVVKKRIPWGRIKQEFVTTDKTIGEIAKEYGVKAATIHERSSRAGGWSKEKEAFKKDVERKAIEQTKVDVIKERVEMVRVGKFLISKGLKAMQEEAMSPENYGQARASIESGVKILHELLPTMKVETEETVSEEAPHLKKWLIKTTITSGVTKKELEQAYEGIEKDI